VSLRDYLTDEIAAKIEVLPEATQRYAELLLDYNETHNIYSKKAYEHLPFHLNDCLTIAQIINDHCEAVSRETFNLYDMGSGSGLPSIIIAQQCPQVHVRAMESRGKKCEFLRKCKSELGLTNFDVIQGNIHEFFHKPYKRSDIVTAKAFAPLEKAKPLAKKLLKEGGLFVMPLGEEQKKGLSRTDKAQLQTLSSRFYFVKS